MAAHTSIVYGPHYECKILLDFPFQFVINVNHFVMNATGKSCDILDSAFRRTRKNIFGVSDDREYEMEGDGEDNNEDEDKDNDKDEGETEFFNDDREEDSLPVKHDKP